MCSSGEADLSVWARGSRLSEITCLCHYFKLAQTRWTSLSEIEFSLATNGRGVLSMVIACVGRTMDKELLCSRRLLLGEESIVW